MQTQTIVNWGMYVEDDALALNSAELLICMWQLLNE